MNRFYLMPGGTNARGEPTPKYATSFSAWSGLDYGGESVWLVYGDAIDHASLVANSDVTAVPADTSDTIGSALSTAQATLEAFNLPADWLTSGMTWRVALKGLALMFVLAQRYNGLETGRLLQGITLDTTTGSLSAARRNRLQQVADSFGLSTTSLTASSTVRDYLKALAAKNWQNIRLSGADL